LSSISSIIPTGPREDLEKSYEYMNDKMSGIAWKWMNSLEDLEYADDICLLSHKYDHMQSKLNDLYRESRKAGLMINCTKTEEIRVNNTINRPITTENRELT
jgi:hypothetical protein